MTTFILIFLAALCFAAAYLWATGDERGVSPSAPGGRPSDNPTDEVVL